MHGRQLSSVALQPPLQLAGTAQRRVAADGKTIAAALIKESKQRAALVAPQPLDAALLSRLRADSCSLSQLDPLSSLVQCPTLRQPSLLEQPGSQSAEFLTLLQDPSIPPHRLEATLYEPRPKSQKPDRDPKGEDFYANVGYAIRTLREELPTLFQEDLTYDIYRDDIAFKDPRNCIEGKQNYRTIFWSLRFHGALFFTRLRVDVQRIWQPEEALIKARWTVRGEPRVPWRAEGLFDGISEFKLDKNGKIYQHKVDNTILSDPPYIKLPILGLNLFGRPAVNIPQAPVPGAFIDASQRVLQKVRSVASSSPKDPSSPAPV